MTALPVLLAALAGGADPTDRDRIVRALEDTTVFSSNETGSCSRISYGSTPGKLDIIIDINNDTSYKIRDGSILLCHVDKGPSGELGDFLHVINRRYGFNLGRPVGTTAWRYTGNSNLLRAEPESGLPAEKRWPLQKFRWTYCPHVAVEDEALADLLKDDAHVTSNVTPLSPTTYRIDLATRGDRYRFRTAEVTLTVPDRRRYAYITRAVVTNNPHPSDVPGTYTQSYCDVVVREMDDRPIPLAKAEEVRFYKGGRYIDSRIWHYDYNIKSGGVAESDPEFTLSHYGFPEPDPEEERRGPRPPLPAQSSVWWRVIGTAAAGLAFMLVGWWIWRATRPKETARGKPTH